MFIGCKTFFLTCMDIRFSMLIEPASVSVCGGGGEGGGERDQYVEQ